jgi:hypothetical protein
MVRKVLSGCMSFLLCFLMIFPSVSNAVKSESAVEPETAVEFVSSAAEPADVFQLKLMEGSPRVGDRFTVAVEGYNLTDLFASEITVEFDAARLVFHSAEPKFTDVQGRASGYAVPVRVEENRIILAHTQVGSAIVGSRMLYALAFEAKREGSANIEIKDARMVGTWSDEVTHAALGSGAEVSVRILDRGSGGDGGGTPTPAVTPTPTAEVTPTPTPVPSHGGGNPGAGVPTPSAGAGGKPTPSVSPTVAPGRPDGSAPVIVKLEGVTGDSGSKRVIVGEKTWREAFAEAAGKAAGIRLEVVNAGSAKEVTVIFPETGLQTEAPDEVVTLQIDTGLAVVSLPWEALVKQAAATHGGMELTVSIVDETEWPDAWRTALKERSVLSVTLRDSSGTVINLPGHPVKLSLPYELKEGQAPERMLAWSLDYDGAMEPVRNGVLEQTSGLLHFVPESWGVFAVIPVEPVFGDLEYVSWAEGAIEGLAARKIVEGTGEGLFQPEREITRAEFVLILINGFGLTDPQAVSSFRDVPAGDWYSIAVASAEKLGIVQGTGDRVFHADGLITRQDMAVMLYRAAKAAEFNWSMGDSGGFIDQASIQPYAQDAVRAMKNSGIVNGRGDGSFIPDAPATRAEAAVIIYRMYERLP